MEEWEEEHPKSTFTMVIDDVNNAINMGQPFLELIWDSPLPARTVVWFSTSTATWESTYYEFYL